MGFFKNLFGGGKKKAETPPKAEKKETYNLPWISPEQNPWGLKLLDLRPISTQMMSTSADSKMATNAISYGQEDGDSFKDATAKSDRTIASDLSIPVDGKLEEGVLFNPSTMEHKWAIYFRNDRLIFIRSWLREALVTAKTTQGDGQLHIHEITGAFTEAEPEAMTKSMLLFLLYSHALGETLPAPIPTELASDPDRAGMWAFSTYGNQAHLGYFDYDFPYQTNSKFRTHSLFHIAVAQGDLEKVAHELEKGANINGLAGDGLAALQWALAGEATSLTYLLEKGADPNVRSTEGATPIMNAVQSDQLEQLNLLIQHGADVNAQDNRGFTALHRAAEMGRTQMVQILLEQGADPAVEAEGHSPLSLATAREETEVIALLEQAQKGD